MDAQIVVRKLLHKNRATKKLNITVTSL